MPVACTFCRISPTNLSTKLANIRAAQRAGEAEDSTEIDGALFLKIRSVCYLRPNAARKIAPTIISNPAIVATKPNEIKNPPNGVLGPHGPKPDTNVSMNAATPMQKDIAPYFPSAFTYSRYQDR